MEWRFKFRVVAPDELEKGTAPFDTTRHITCWDEYGGEPGGFAISPVDTDERLSKEDWIEVSRLWEVWCNESEPKDHLLAVEMGGGTLNDQWEWDYVKHADLGAYQVATFQSNDRGGTGIFVMNP